MRVPGWVCAGMRPSVVRVSCRTRPLPSSTPKISHVRLPLDTNAMCLPSGDHEGPELESGRPWIFRTFRPSAWATKITPDSVNAIRRPSGEHLDPAGLAGYHSPNLAGAAVHHAEPWALRLPISLEHNPLAVRSQIWRPTKIVEFTREGQLPLTRSIAPNNVDFRLVGPTRVEDHTAAAVGRRLRQTGTTTELKKDDNCGCARCVHGLFRSEV